MAVRACVSAGLWSEICIGIKVKKTLEVDGGDIFRDFPTRDFLRFAYREKNYNFD